MSSPHKSPKKKSGSGFGETLAEVGKVYTVYIAIITTLISVVTLWICYKLYERADDGSEEKENLKMVMIITASITLILWGLVYAAQYSKTMAQVAGVFGILAILGAIVQAFRTKDVEAKMRR